MSCIENPSFGITVGETRDSLDRFSLSIDMLDGT